MYIFLYIYIYLQILKKAYTEILIEMMNDLS